MSDLDDSPRDLRKRSFLWTFVVCAGLPAVAALSQYVDQPSTEIGIGQGTVLLIFALPYLWGIALVAGLAVVWKGTRETGWGIVLGSLAGAVVGFSLCSGILFGLDPL